MRYKEEEDVENPRKDSILEINQSSRAACNFSPNLLLA